MPPHTTDDRRDEPVLRVGQVTHLEASGHGVVRVGGREVAIPGTLPGERVRFEWVETTSIARLIDLLEASPVRVTPRCVHFGECGGCSWQHVSYAEQLRLKRVRVQYLLDEALGRRRVSVGSTVPTPGDPDASAPWHFRNKVSFAFDHDRRGDLVMGHLRQRSRRVLDVTECPVHSEAGNTLAFTVKDALREANVPCGQPPDGVARYLVARVGAATGEVLATLVATMPDPGLKEVSKRVLAGDRPPDGWHLNTNSGVGPQLFGRETIHLAGRERLKEVVGGATFLISATAFFQTNVAAAARLQEIVLAAMGAPGPTLDLYAGLGFFAIPLALRGHTVVAIEENPAAVQDGMLSAQANGLDPTRCRFVRGKTEYALARVTRAGRSYDAVVLDPPRTGAHPQVLRALRDHIRPRRIVYVSCDPEALAHDLQALVPHRPHEGGYEVASVTPIDMFPHTTHVEMVAVLDRT